MKFRIVLARGGIAEGFKRRRAGFGEFSGKTLDNCPRGRSREAQDRDRGAPRAGGDGEDRVVFETGRCSHQKNSQTVPVSWPGSTRPFKLQSWESGCPAQGPD